jgi:outer membrane protein assembly factor BamB
MAGQADGDYSLHSPGVGLDGMVYVSLPNGKLYAIAPDGTQRWVIQAGIGGGVDGPVSVGPDGTIYAAGTVPDPNGNGAAGAIFALTPAGATKWVFNQTDQLIMAGPNVGPDGNIYAVTDWPGIGLFSLTPQGQLRFSVPGFSEQGPLGQSIAFGPNQLYFAFDGGATGPSQALLAYDFNGNQRFVATPTPNVAQPAVGPNGNVGSSDLPDRRSQPLGILSGRCQVVAVHSDDEQHHREPGRWPGQYRVHDVQPFDVVCD